jgi:vancomycin resistance protein VanJ
MPTPTLLRLLVWFYVGLVSFWFGARLIWFDQFVWLALLNTLAFYVLLPALVFLLIAIVLQLRGRSVKSLIATLLIPLLLFIYLFGALLLPPQLRPNRRFRAAIQPQNTFRVMSFNILWSNFNMTKIAQTVREAKPDVIGLQEVRSQHIPMLKQTLPDYPYSAFHSNQSLFHNVGILSKFPIRSTEVLPDRPMERGLKVVVEIQGRPLTVIVAHLIPPNVPLFPIDQFGSLMQERYVRRGQEIEQLRQVIQRRESPAIVLCDCNLTDTAQTYPQLQSFLQDGFRSAGWGLGHTFQGEEWQFPRQRLDYVWHTSDLLAIDAEVGADGGSDHLPIVAKLGFQK